MKYVYILLLLVLPMLSFADGSCKEASGIVNFVSPDGTIIVSSSPLHLPHNGPYEPTDTWDTSLLYQPKLSYSKIPDGTSVIMNINGESTHLDHVVSNGNQYISIHIGYITTKNSCNRVFNVQYSITPDDLADSISKT